MYYAQFDDNTKTPFASKVANVCAAYKQRIGAKANVCLVSVQDFDKARGTTPNGEPITINGVIVRAGPTVNPHNFHAMREGDSK